MMNTRFTSRAVKVLKFAQYAAQEMEQNYIGTKHLLLGLVHEDINICDNFKRKVVRIFQ